MARKGGNPELGELRKDYWSNRVKPKLELIEGWARAGFTDKDIYTNLGIGETTWYDFLNTHRELRDAVDVGRHHAEIIAENSLFKKVTGYSYKEVYKQRVKVYDEDGEWTGQYEMATVKSVLKHVPPDTNAAVYWLEHRAPNRWQRNPLPGIDVDEVNNTIKSLADLLCRAVPERKIGDEEL